MLRSHYSSEVPKEDGARVKLAGFVAAIRDIGRIKFLLLRDREGAIQVTVKRGEVREEIIKLTEEIPKESFVVVEGKTRISEQAPGGVEILPESIKIVSKAAVPFPIDISGKIQTSLDKRIDWRFLDMRRKEIMDIFILEAKVVRYLEEFCENNGFIRIFTSRLTSAATEGGADYFPVMYFDREAFLAQSPQLYKESVLASGIDRVYDVGFVYRAEPHNTTRHLCEYISFDTELVCETLEELLDVKEEMMRYLFDKLNRDKKVREILSVYNQEIRFPKRIPRITLEEANKILRERGVETGEDLSPRGERVLCDYCRETYDSEFVFVTHFPFAGKPFYLMRCRENNQLSLSFDLLYRGLEITSGGIREHRYEERINNIKAKGLNPEQYDHLRFFKYGMPPHGGFGTGIERVVMKILGLSNIREAALFPRDPNRLKP